MSEQPSSDANNSSVLPAESRRADIAQSWTGDVPKEANITHAEVCAYLASSFNKCPFLIANQITMGFKDGQFYCEVDMQPSLVGNVAFKILHGGVAATMLDNVGGVETMAAIYSMPDIPLEERMRKISRVATIDMRTDYLAPGRGNHFIARARVVRLGKKTSTTQMEMVNDTGTLIAIGTATYGY